MPPPLPHDLPTEVLFGEGVSSQAGECAGRIGSKALLVTGKSSAHKSGAIDRILPSLTAAGIEMEIFDDVKANPTISTVSEGAERAKSFNADIIIAIGGGSPLDAAKGIAVLAVNDGPPQKYFGADPVIDPLPVIAVPTTSGTGSEVTPYAVIVDTSTVPPAKQTIRTPLIYPRTALVDPELTYSMPPPITADTGMDALSHVLEGCLCSNRGPVTDGIAMESVRLVLRHLRQACDSPRNADARSGMAMASLLAGVVISHTGTELVHTMGYRLTLRFDVPHGRANAMLMPHVIRLYSPSDVLGWMCKTLGGKWVPHRKTGDFIAREMDELNADVGIEKSLGLSISDKELDGLAREIVVEERKMANCHRRPTFEEVREIFKAVISLP